MKCYPLMISKRFPKTHPKTDQATKFMEKIQHYDKIHTIRANYELWKKRFEEIEKGNAYLSVRQWADKPYRSKQHEIFRYDNRRKIGVEKLEFLKNGRIRIDGKLSDTSHLDLAKNDGLSKQDFEDWFRDYTTEPMAIIHFTDFRYSLINAFEDKNQYHEL